MMPDRPALGDYSDTGWHKCSSDRRPRSTHRRSARSHFTPTYASWLNQVERWFALLTERQIRRGVHRSVQELENAVSAYIANHNEAPRPFRWTKSADDILQSIARFCQRTLATHAAS
ncbi:MAG: transposase [Sphingomonas sp.]|nr:transposase [Sphingomonas sp.]